VLFISYLIYGFLRPFLSREWRREIEEELEDETGDSAHGESPPPPP
jgi:CDP-diacylglycerol--serine O-phosphatidyltransferase